MRLRAASPLAETMSHLPPPPLAMRVTMSFEEPGYIALTLHPVVAVNGFTHDVSAYPSHAIRLSWPSPAPIVVCGFMLAVGGGAADEPPLLPVTHAVSAMTTADAAVASRNQMPDPEAPCLASRGWIPTIQSRDAMTCLICV